MPVSINEFPSFSPRPRPQRLTLGENYYLPDHDEVHFDWDYRQIKTGNMCARGLGKVTQNYQHGTRALLECMHCDHRQVVFVGPDGEIVYPAPR